MSELNGKRSREWSVGFIWVFTILAAVVTVTVGAVMRGKSYIPVSVLLVIYCMVPFFASFELSLIHI